MAKIEVGKLLQLADLLDGVDEREFNLRRWESVGRCGTTRCAIGWGIHAGILNLRIVPSDNPDWGDPVVAPESGHQNWAAVCFELGLEYEQAYYLFSGRRKKTAADVAARIRQFVDENRPIDYRPVRPEPLVST